MESWPYGHMVEVTLPNGPPLDAGVFNLIVVYTILHGQCAGRLQPGDEIVWFNGSLVPNQKTLITLLRGAAQCMPIVLSVWRIDDSHANYEQIMHERMAAKLPPHLADRVLVHLRAADTQTRSGFGVQGSRHAPERRERVRLSDPAAASSTDIFTPTSVLQQYTLPETPRMRRLRESPPSPAPPVLTAGLGEEWGGEPSNQQTVGQRPAGPTSS